MSSKQRRVLLILALIGLVTFALFLYPNSYGAGSDAILADASGDEYVTYPNVIRILTPGNTFNETRANLFLYEDYHYGYPFYAFSALVLLPVRLAYGSALPAHMQLNMLLLRQLINVLPMVLAAGLLVFMQTRFQSLWKSIALFIFLLTIRGVVREHIWWWHPDALTVLCVVLTLFFLDRDRLRFSRNFYLAAFFCGLATAIKLQGVFFFLTIPAYLVAGLWQKRVRFSKAVWAAVLFLVVMGGVTVFSNPFLFSSQQRERMLVIQAQKQQEISTGYTHDDPMYYSKGPQWWVSTLEKWYGQPLFLFFLFGSLVAGCIWGPRTYTNRLLLTWVVPYTIYLLYFVAVKPDHYWLPVMLPLFSCAFTLVDILNERTPQWRSSIFSSAYTRQKAVMALVVIALSWQTILNLARPVSGNVVVYQTAISRGITQLETIR